MPTATGVQFPETWAHSTERTLAYVLLALMELAKVLLSLALPLLPRGPLVVHLSVGQGAPGRYPRVLCDPDA